MDPSYLMLQRRLCFLVGVFVFFIATDTAWGFSSKTNQVIRKEISGGIHPATALFSRSSPLGFGWGQLFQKSYSKAPDITSYRTGESAFPWIFTGRCIFVPSLIKVDEQAANSSNDNLFVLNLFGWTLGGTVALEYDDSPVGYYREWVKLGGLAVYPRRSTTQQSLLIGQFGSRLYVSRPEAEVLCERVWGLVANKGASIQFLDEQDCNNSPIRLVQSTNTRGDSIALTASGWNHVRKSGGVSFEKLSLLVWTPTIKAIWCCLLRFPLSFYRDNSKEDEDGDNLLPLHRLRLSGRVRPTRIDAETTGATSLPKSQKTMYFGLGLAVENLIIEISPPVSGP